MKEPWMTPPDPPLVRGGSGFSSLVKGGSDFFSLVGGNGFRCDRRQFLKLAGLSLLGTQVPLMMAEPATAATVIKPPRLKIGDTIGLVSPASLIDAEDLETATRFLKTMGFEVKPAPHILNEYGYLGGKDEDRAADLNGMFADDTVQGILTTRGGWGSGRILSLLDYDLIRRNPKIILGYSDITSLLLAIYARCGVITFHGPLAIYTWSLFSLNYIHQMLMAGRAMSLQNLDSIPVETITPGKARGRLLGGNLSVISDLLGSPYVPDWKQGILFLEEIGEDIYRVDRMLTHLKLAGVLDQVAGIIFGQCLDCLPSEDDDPSLTLRQVLLDHIRPLGIPAWYGSMIGHIRDQFIVPLGVEVEIDAELGVIRMLESAVS